MIDLRKVIFGALKGDPELQALVGDRIFQRGSTLDGVPPTEQVPYIVYNLGQAFNKGPSALRALSQGLQVWVHDEPGDYHRIDTILARVKVVLEGVEAGDPVGFLEIRHFETSMDLWDNLLKHLVRYSRLGATLTQEEATNA